MSARRLSFLMTTLTAPRSSGPVAWGIAIAIVLLAGTTAYRTIASCAPSSFELIRYLKANFGGCVTPPDQQLSIDIRLASYCAAPNECANPECLRQKIQDSCRGVASCSVTDFSRICGDPHGGAVKELSISYVCGGKQRNGHALDPDKTLTLSCQ